MRVLHRPPLIPVWMSTNNKARRRHRQLRQSPTGFPARRVLLFPHLLLGSGFPANNQLFPLCFIRLTYLNTSIPPGSLIQGRLHILHLPTLQSQQPALDILHQKNLHIPRQICKDVNHILCLLHDLQLLLTVLLVHLCPQHPAARGKAII